MEEKKIYKTGDVVPETALYECSVCNDLKKPIRQRLKEGEKFPRCSGCSDTDIWQKASSTLDMPTGCHC